MVAKCWKMMKIELQFIIYSLNFSPMILVKIIINISEGMLLILSKVFLMYLLLKNIMNYSNNKINTENQLYIMLLFLTLLWVSDFCWKEKKNSWILIKKINSGTLPWLWLSWIIVLKLLKFWLELGLNLVLGFTITEKISTIIMKNLLISIKKKIGFILKKKRMKREKNN